MIRVGAPIWLGLRFESLPLEIIEHDGGRPLAVVEQQRVFLSNHDAIEPGIAIATAHALVANLVAVSRDPQGEHQALQDLALWAYQVTPAVTVADDNSLLLEIGSCRQLYGNLSQLLARIQAALAQRGHSVLMGLAHTPKAAWLLAQWGPAPALREGGGIDSKVLQQQLAMVPVPALPVDAKVRTRFQHMGIETLGRVLGFDHAVLGKRFGAECIRYLQQSR